MSTYRADIDGLRAIAIIVVVLFHGGFGAFSGGYVGVDVFFVISGYLITQLILPDIRSHQFSLVDFYERRIRRLLPALSVMLGSTALLGSIVLMPADLEQFGASLAAAATFVSNFLFWRDDGYFAGPAELKPLLHTWSLGIEEQYYLLFPGLLLWLTRTMPRHLTTATLVLFLLSLAVSIWSTAYAPAAGFYLIAGRFWELLLGALLSMGLIPALTNRRCCNAAAIAGLALIGLSATMYTGTTAFPGMAALLPCVGTALVIHSGAEVQTLPRRLLSMRPIAFVGLISYSLYLWHWPLLALLKQVLPRQTDVLERSAVLGIAVLLAVASWRYVEAPFRGRNGVLSQRQLFYGATAVTAMLLAAGAAMVAMSGWPQRLPADVAALAAAAHDRGPFTQDCFNPSIAALRNGELCRIGSPTAAAPTFLLWGDSHANAVAGAVAEAAAAADRAGLLAAAAACPPLLDVLRIDSRRGRECVEFNRAALQLVIDDPNITSVILAARWVISARGTRYKFEPGASVLIGDAATPRPSIEQNLAVFERGLGRTLHALADAGKRIIVIGPVPEIGWRVPDALAKAAYFGTAADIAPSRAEFDARQQPVFDSLATLQREVAFSIVWPHAVLCDALRCDVVKDGQPRYHDEEHLSATGAVELVPLLRPIFH